MPTIQIGSKITVANAKLAAALVAMGKAQYVQDGEKVEAPKDENETDKPKRTYKTKVLKAA